MAHQNQRYIIFQGPFPGALLISNFGPKTEIRYQERTREWTRKMCNLDLSTLFIITPVKLYIIYNIKY